ncbi:MULTISPECIES: hypothetical protein [Peptoniphilus]|uniref:hypothetical protein n=1 Tax=Peptoniphilus TaxID=162289 RepID=UPI0008DABAD3|nr:MULTISPECIES: hypothetical protein [Peptoniphilus]MDU8978384.1 hypothetical protein [Clostridium perfringens]MBS6611600.1 hypothetical protein [Peptoniphilus harei]MDU1955757.1 hypothetical protein [Peptoniphilus lacydonensis]MDU2110788.1 hypothetical protein [Peptoniphilus lacydonensis]MDU5275995.1 hypothetical protein [Peptoniphilus lacydonensis]
MNFKTKNVLKYLAIFVILYLLFKVSYASRSHIVFNEFEGKNHTLNYFISLLTFNIVGMFLIKKSIIGHDFYLILISFNVIDAIATAGDIAYSQNDNYLFFIIPCIFIIFECFQYYKENKKLKSK